MLVVLIAAAVIAIAVVACCGCCSGLCGGLAVLAGTVVRRCFDVVAVVVVVDVSVGS